MFDSAADARKTIAEFFDPQLTQEIVAALVPAIVLAPIGDMPEDDAAEPEAADDAAPLGGTRLGGLPDLPAGLAWPRPGAPSDPEAIARRGNESAAAEMRAHMALGLPYAFVGQIDLAEVAALGAVAAPLPRHGRLLFFYDLAVGPWETGERPTRVVHDTSPREALVRCPMPPDLAAAIARHRQEAVAAFAAQGLELPTEDEGGTYAAPAQRRKPMPTLRLPHAHTFEIDAVAPLVAAYAALPDPAQRDLVETYSELREAADDGFDGERWCRQQLLGAPMPEQDDPRFDAAVWARFGKPHLSSEEWGVHRDEMLRAARDWRLLLQLDLADWTQASFAEGTVFFLIRDTDLAACRFDRVVGIYQQT